MSATKKWFMQHLPLSLPWLPGNACSPHTNGHRTEAWQYSNTNFCSGMKQWTQQVIATGPSGPNVFSVSCTFAKQFMTATPR